MRGLAERLGSGLPKGGFVRSVAVLAGGTALGQTVLVLSAPLLTRVYAPEDFGVLAVYSSILSTLVALSSFRYEAVIPLPESEDTANQVLVMCLVLVFSMSLLCGGAIWVLRDAIATTLKVPPLAGYLWLLPVSLAGAGAYQAFNLWAVRGRAFAAIAQTRITQSIAQIAVQLGLGVVHGGPLGLLVGDALGRTAGMTTLAALGSAQRRWSVRRASAREMARLAVRYRHFPLYGSGSVLANTLGVTLPALLVASLFGAQTAGWFALTQRIIGVPMALVGQAIGQVYLGEAYRLRREAAGELRQLFSSTAQRLLIASAGLVIPIGVLGKVVTPYLFGSVWAEAGHLLLLLTPSYVAQFVVSPLSQTATVMERQDLEVVISVSRVASIVCVFLAGHAAGWSPQATLAVYSATGFVSYGVLFGVYRSLLPLPARAE